MTTGVLLSEYPKFDHEPFLGLVPYSLPWDITNNGSTINAKVPRAKRFTCTSYSTSGVERSRDGKTVFIRMESPLDEATSTISGIQKAAIWMTKTCIEFWTAMEKYIYTQFKLPDAIYKVYVLTGEPTLKEVKDSKVFNQTMTFFPSAKYSKYFKYENKKQVEIPLNQMIDRKNSFFRLDLTMKYFEIRYVPEEKAFFIMGYANVPRVTYLGVAMEGEAQKVETTSWEDRAAQEIDNNMETLVQLSKKRKLDVIDKK